MQGIADFLFVELAIQWELWKLGESSLLSAQVKSVLVFGVRVNETDHQWASHRMPLRQLN